MMGRPKVLCVDDEIDVLEGLEQHLRRRYTMTKAVGGEQGLMALRDNGPFAVVLSDMRMPKMDGAVFLAKARAASPDTVRMLLTGQTDIESAISAVNGGQIFRFLTKPCRPAALLGAFDQAVRQHRLINAERELLEKTLRGSIDALADVLAITNPMLFGRASRLKRHVGAMAEAIELEDRWPVEVAAMLCLLGHATLPPEVVEKIYFGRELTSKEQTMVDAAPAATRRLVERIPRLDPVLEILDQQQAPFEAKGKAAVPCMGARMLKVAADFDLLETLGCAPQLAIDTLRGRAGLYDPALIDAMGRLHGASDSVVTDVRELPVTALRPGMILAEDIKTRTGSVFVARGYEVTERFVERTKNFEPGFIIEPIRVIVASETGVGTAGGRL